MPKYKGYETDLGGTKFVFPAISLGMLRNGLMEKMETHDQLLADGKMNQALILRGEIILEALRRNYPESEISDANFWDSIDMANSRDIWLSVLGISGFTPGEAEAATGDTKSGVSTLPSPQPMGGQ